MYGEKQAEFTPFLQFFLANVNRFNQEKKEEIYLSHPHTATEKERIIPNAIERKKTIYESVFGKIFTVLLGFVIILFLVYGLPYMGIPSLLKLYIFLIPGFFYMAYRVFIKKG